MLPHAATSGHRSPERHRERFVTPRGADLKTGRAWAIKENLRDFWEYRRRGWGERHFKSWYFWATHSRLQPMIEAARTLKRHEAGLYCYFSHRITNAAAEGLNSRIQAIRVSVRGYRNRENFKTAIYVHCGGFDIYPAPHDLGYPRRTQKRRVFRTLQARRLLPSPAPTLPRLHQRARAGAVPGQAIRPYRVLRSSANTVRMFIQARVVVGLPFQGAREPWQHVRACLAVASNEAYEAGMVVLVRVGPFGDLPGASKKVQLQLLDPVPTETGIRLPLRWIATGASGHLFPALDADLEFSAVNARTSELQITARYEPPLGPLGARLDRALLRLAAEATLRSFLRHLTNALGEAQGAADVGWAPLPRDLAIEFLNPG